MAELSVKLSFEKLLHDKIAKLLQDTFNETGLRIDRISVDWIDITSAGKADFIVHDITLVTLTRR